MRDKFFEMYSTNKGYYLQKFIDKKGNIHIIKILRDNGKKKGNRKSRSNKKRVRGIYQLCLKDDNKCSYIKEIDSKTDNRKNVNDAMKYFNGSKNKYPYRDFIHYYENMSEFNRRMAKDYFHSSIPDIKKHRRSVHKKIKSKKSKKSKRYNK